MTYDITKMQDSTTLAGDIMCGRSLYDDYQFQHCHKKDDLKFTHFSLTKSTIVMFHNR